MTIQEAMEITREMEKLFYGCGHDDPDLFCEDDCPHKDLCDKHELYWGCGVWEEAMGEDL